MKRKLISLVFALALMIGAAVIMPSLGIIKASAKTTYFENFTMNINSSKWKDVTKSVNNVDAAYYYIGDLSNPMNSTAVFTVTTKKDVIDINIADMAEVIVAQHENNGYNVTDHKVIKLNGYEALRVDATGNDNGTKMRMSQYLLIENNIYYVISFGSDDSVYNKMKPELESVVNTFKPLVRKSVAKADVKLKNIYYTGKAVKTKAVVKLGKKTLKEGTDYTISYKNNTNIGTATATIKGKNAYKGSVKATFKICPKKSKLSKVTSPKTKQIKATYSKVKGVTGYQISYSTSKDFTKDTTKTVSSKKTSKTITKLSKGKTYYVKVRSYKTVSGKKYYSGWSNVKKIKVK